jgi:hypothetical protein
VDESNAHQPASTVMLMLSADLHWRRKEWQAAANAALQVLDRRPKDFHTLAVLVTSYGHLQQHKTALPFAERLTRAVPPSWNSVVTAKGRASYRMTILRCDEEAQGDRAALAWAKELHLCAYDRQ